MDLPPIDEVTAEAYQVPTDRPEADGTLSWSSTVMVTVTVRAGDVTGLGFTYAGASAKTVVDEKLTPVIDGGDPVDVPGLHHGMAQACRNLGRPGVASCAISATDIALWDLKARSLDLSLVELFGRARPAAAIYGSGGFTTYSDEVTRAQLETWVDDWAIPRVKIKIGESWGGDPGRDLHRVDLARQVVGDTIELYVDANGAYGVKQAIRLGRAMVEQFGVNWFEEPVSSDDLSGLHQVRDGCAADVAAGEYGYTPEYFTPMIAAGAVDCVQADVTRCGGYTDWLAVAHLAAANGLEISGHCAPNLHAPVAVSIPNLRHLEYFHDHTRIEHLLFDGVLGPDHGALVPTGDAPGHGLCLRRADAAPYRIA